MSVLPILKMGDELLEKKCHKVTKFDKRLDLLLRDMEDTLRDAGGAGLAAPQIGTLRRVFLVMLGDEVREYINPEIIEKTGEQTPVEGCLSVPGIWGRIKRPMHVKLRAQNRKGEFFEEEGAELLAEIFDHENDHLEGKLFYGDIIEIIERDDEEA